MTAGAEGEGGGAIFLTGATGYVGGQLLPLLERRGERVRCLTRRPEALARRVGERTEVVAGDVLDPASLAAAMDGAAAAYYLIHSMGAGKDFEALDRRAAASFAGAADEAGVGRIVYVGGLADETADLSPHLRSRHEVGGILRESAAQVVEFRASLVIGAGSLSFELVRALVNRLPVMICPRWVRTEAQPIGIDDLLAYLLAALELPPGESRVFEVGGPERVSYSGIMSEVARQQGRRRLMIPVPVLTPWLSSLWLALVTPTRFAVGRRLIEGVRTPSVVRDPSALTAFDIRPVGLAEAVRRALSDPAVDATPAP